MLRKIFASTLLASMVSFQFLLFTVPKQLVYADQAPAPVTETPVVPTVPYLIISAVQITGGTGHTQEDFIELYNPTAQPFDLNGHRLVKRTAAASTDTLIFAWTESTVVEGHHFYLWANSSFSGLAVPADSTSTATLADNNGIALREGGNDTGVILDDIAWGSTANGFTVVSDSNPGANESIVRSDLFSVEPASFTIGASNPRNSSVLLEPTPPDDDPPPDDPPVEDPPQDDDPPADPPPDSEPVEITITELHPNPVGSDSGHEQIELLNEGSSPVDLTGYKLDDINPNDALSSNAYELPELEIDEGEYLAITVPVGKFAMNNTSGDVITLFNPDDEDVATVAYTETTPEGKSFSLFNDGDWLWAPPTLGQQNGSPPDPEEEEDDEEEEEDTETAPDYGDYDNTGLQINEVYPAPKVGEKEFVELYNSGEETAQLAVVSIWVGERHKNLLEHKLDPGDYYVIEQADLPLQLRNSGQTVKLMEESDKLDEISYPEMSAGNSYARFEDGFLLSIKVTMDHQNILELPETVKKVATATAEKTTASKVAKAAKPATTKTAAKTTTGNSNTNKSTTTNLPTGLTTDANTNTEISPKPPENKKDSWGKIIAMGAAAVTAGVVALYKLVFSSGIE